MTQWLSEASVQFWFAAYHAVLRVDVRTRAHVGARVLVCTFSLCLPDIALCTGDYPHFVRALCWVCCFAEHCCVCVFGLFVWMSFILPCLGRIMQPADPSLPFHTPSQRRMKEWEPPVIWWLGNRERERGRVTVRLGERVHATEKWG